MKWYVGLFSEIITGTLGIGSILYIENDDSLSLPITTQQSLAITVFVVAFIGGFLAPYHVMKTAKYASTLSGTLLGIPLVIVLIATGEISQDDNGDWATAFFFILLILVAVGLMIAIIVVTILLFVGGYIGSIFGRLVFSVNNFEDDSLQAKYDRRR